MKWRDREMTKTMLAVLTIAEHTGMNNLLMPLIDFEMNEVHWDKVDFTALSPDESAALSWAWCLWHGVQISEGSGMRDPFLGFQDMTPELRVLAVNALAKLV